MCWLRFPLRLFTFVKRYGTFLSAYHCSIIDPTYGIDHANYFSIVEYKINPFKSFHWHVVHWYDNLLSIVGLYSL